MRLRMPSRAPATGAGAPALTVELEIIEPAEERGGGIGAPLCAAALLKRRQQPLVPRQQLVRIGEDDGEGALLKQLPNELLRTGRAG